MVGRTTILGSHDGPCPAPSNTVDCIPSEGFSHSIGSVRSAPDGTLWVGSGDASSLNFVDELALRTYDTQSMAGKIMHIDRNGNGLPGHPFCPANNGCSTSGSGSHAGSYRVLVRARDTAGNVSELPLTARVAREGRSEPPLVRLAGRAPLEPVELTEDHDRLGTQVAVDCAPVLPRELAHAVIELGVADLAVLGFLCGLELGDAVLVAALLLAGRAQRASHGERDQHRQDEQCEGVFHGAEPSGRYARESSLPSRAEYSARTRRRRASGVGHAATSAPSNAIAPPIQIHATSGDTIARKAAGGGSRR